MGNTSRTDDVRIVRELTKPDSSISSVARKFGIDRETVRKAKERVLTGQNPDFNPSDPMIRSDAMRLIRSKRKDGFTLDQLASKLKTNIDGAKKVVRHLIHHDGYNIVSNGNTWQLLDVLPTAEPLNLKALVGDEFLFGVISDKHMASNYYREDVLEAAYSIFKQRGIKVVLDAGNLIDGEFKFNKYELLTTGAHNQAQYVADHHPQRDGITTYFITGDCHEGWYQSREGIKIGWYIQKVCEDSGRKDLKWIGHIEADVILEQPLGRTHIRLVHPGGGTPYALSYPSQKMVESFQGGEKPNMLILGHYHKFDVTYPREVTTIQPGCVQDQTSFMRRKHLAAHVGFCIVKISRRMDGTLGNVGVEWFPFYDRKYHQKLNQYGGEYILGKEEIKAEVKIKG